MKSCVGGLNAVKDGEYLGTERRRILYIVGLEERHLLLGGIAEHNKAVLLI